MNDDNENRSRAARSAPPPLLDSSLPKVDSWLPSKRAGMFRRRLVLELIILRNNIRILFHKSLYRFYLVRKRLVLLVSSLRVRFRLFQTERKLIAKYGRDWRLRVLNDECVQSLETFRYVHGVMESNRDVGQTREPKAKPAGHDGSVNLEK